MAATRWAEPGGVSGGLGVLYLVLCDVVRAAVPQGYDKEGEGTIEAAAVMLIADEGAHLGIDALSSGVEGPIERVEFCT